MKVDGFTEILIVSGKANKTKRNPIVIAYICFPVFFVFDKNKYQKISFLNLIMVRFLRNHNQIYMTHFDIFLSINYHFIELNLNATIWFLRDSVELSNNLSANFKLAHLPTEFIFIMKTHITISKQFFYFNIPFKMWFQNYLLNRLLCQNCLTGKLKWKVIFGYNMKNVNTP